jgi:transaldolase/glucose-6-phosphate isomerase
MTTTPVTHPAATANPLRALGQFGQSVWLDYIRRSLITSGELQRLIDDDGLRGMTSNPAIFEKALASTDYKDVLEDPASRKLDAKALYEQIAIRDIQAAADALAPIYKSSNAHDGYVSLEVSPTLARDTAGTLEEARRLWKAVDRKNLMVKVPGTAEGIPAFRQLISEGINVNVTLLFAQSVYEQVAEAYIAALETRAAQGLDLSQIASVASFFVSRIDSAIDAMPAAKAAGIAGKVAIANAKLTYEKSNELYSSPRWQALSKKGAQKQRLLWASTSSKNPAYRDVIYVEELIGPDTVNTIPPATFDAFRDHGKLRKSLVEDVPAAHAVMDSLAKAGISMKAVTDKLLEEGLTQFENAFAALLKATGKASSKVNRQSYKISPQFAAEVKASLEDWKANDKVHRLWRGDASLWSVTDEAQWVGWLGIANEQIAHIEHLQKVAEEIKKEGYKHALLLGMGGSSLCPEVMRMTFGKIDGFPEMHVLDSTDPAQIDAIEKQIDLSSTVFIVSSKSGGTLEPNIFKQYFFKRATDTVGAAEASKRFIAITDPGSKMQHVAESDHFRYIFYGLPTIGGRYSALSDFGMVPAAIMGVDVPRFLAATEEMVHSCTPANAIEENPGVVLGTVLGVLAKNGHDKLTLISSPGIYDLGAWLEQLIAESTGKIGKGIIPVDREEIGDPSVYGNDRIFAYLRLESAPDKAQDSAVAALEAAGQPVIRIAVSEPYNLGEEFFRWEIATAVAGSIIGINPFNQPDVEASKIETRKLTDEYEKTGHLAPEKPILEAGAIKLFADEKNAAELKKLAGDDQTLTGYLKAHLGRLKVGDYCALLGYIQMNEGHENSLQSVRHAIRDKKKVATCLGFGPRFLHSTGQAYKGGPNSGVFLQITCDDAADLPVPGQTYTFGIVKAAQARGDFQVLADRGRRALRIHLGPDVEAGLGQFATLIKGAI